MDWPNVSQKKGFSMRWNCKEWNRRDGMTLMWLLATNPYDSLTFSIDVLLYMYRLITNAFKLIRMNIGASLITFGCLPSHFIYLHPDTSQQIISNQFIWSDWFGYFVVIIWNLCVRSVVALLLNYRNHIECILTHKYGTREREGRRVYVFRSSIDSIHAASFIFKLIDHTPNYIFHFGIPTIPLNDAMKQFHRNP